MAQSIKGLACLGNGTFSTLIDRKGQLVWTCLPRFDGDPVFGSLVMRTGTANDMGYYDIQMQNFSRAEQEFIRNTPVLKTTLYDNDGSQLDILDYLPRFIQDDRPYRPITFVRMLKPVSGTPNVSIRLRPTFGYGWGAPEKTRGSNHVRFLLSNMTIRLTTNVPVSYIVDETPFFVDQAYHLVLMPDESLHQPLQDMTESFFRKTVEYWQNWARGLVVPFEWQDEVIRTAITLKLHNYEETGAFVEAMTSSIPTAPDGGFNIDQRYCAVRESYYLLQVLNMLGDGQTAEKYLEFLVNAVGGEFIPRGSVLTLSDPKSKVPELPKVQPVYGLAKEKRLNVKTVHRLAGYRQQGPVYIGSKASGEKHYDAIGAIILSLSQLFFDHRFLIPVNVRHYKLLDQLGRHALECYQQASHSSVVSDPDKQYEPNGVQTYSAAMCWAACNRLAKVTQAAEKLFKDSADLDGIDWNQHANQIRDDIMKSAWNESLGAFTSEFGGHTVDANVLRLPVIGFIGATDPKMISSVAVVEKTLRQGKYIKAFASDASCSIAATFWYVEALAELGRVAEARSLFEDVVALAKDEDPLRESGSVKERTPTGVLSGTVDAETGELWGNYPEHQW
eukprot:TRINITY_DN1957_c0_g1_i2.p1 TRINITY_DN1957_c0_g1~~TRINITY_DN1957_c0_g1_i2.p1  ORF type:complete len:617 (-),score=143.43 TRINITY_DN1957_c0_g1_i2:208-2058(-)